MIDSFLNSAATRVTDLADVPRGRRLGRTLPRRYGVTAAHGVRTLPARPARGVERRPSIEEVIAEYLASQPAQLYRGGA